jgi:hypothetical protein
MKTRFFTLALWITLPAFAQQAHQHAAPDNAPPPAQHQGHSPYAAMQGRAIKALSDQQTADLRAGKGMSLALPAELNGYPGPSHVLELADALDLNDEQKRKTQTLFAQMQAEAKTLGESVIAGERALDRLFSEKTANAAGVQEAAANAARAHGQLRAAHLQYHLSMVEVLTPAQAGMYRRLRGYD